MQLRVLLGFLGLIFLQVSCSSVVDTYDDEELVIDIQRRMSEVAKRCLSHDFNELACVNLPKGNMYLPMPIYNQISKEIANKANRELRSSLPQLVMYEIFLSYSTGVSTAQEEVRYAIDEIKQKIEDDNLDHCRSACLLQCFTSNAIDYDYNMIESSSYSVFSPADMGPYETLAYGQGVCRNFSTLYDEMAYELGMENVWTVMTWGGSDKVSISDSDSNHRVVGYKEDDLYYLIEPQRDPIEQGRCDRYEYLPPTFLE